MSFSEEFGISIKGMKICEIDSESIKFRSLESVSNRKNGMNGLTPIDKEILLFLEGIRRKTRKPFVVDKAYEDLSGIVFVAEGIVKQVRDKFRSLGVRLEDLINTEEIIKETLGQEVGIELINLFNDAGFMDLDKVYSLPKLLNVIKRGLNGETVVLTGAFCPDYDYEETGNKETPYRYTFKKVNDGVGLVAQQFVRVLPKLVNFLNKFSIKYECHFGIGDFEFDSNEIVGKTGLSSRGDGVQKCKNSLEAFRRSLPEIDMTLMLFEEEFAGQDVWGSYLKEALDKLKEREYLNVKSNTGLELCTVFYQIAERNKSFYCSWYKIDESAYWNDMDSLLDMLVEKYIIPQMAEYATMGRIFAERFKNRPIIHISGDRPEMQVGMHMYPEEDFPTLSCKRMY